MSTKETYLSFIRYIFSEIISSILLSIKGFYDIDITVPPHRQRRYRMKQEEEKNHEKKKKKKTKKKNAQRRKKKNVENSDHK